MIYFSLGQPARRQDMISFRGWRPGLRLLGSRIATDLVFVSAHF